MLFYTVGQSRIFLTMLYAGLIAGAYVSIDGALRRLFEAGQFLSLAMGLVLGAVMAAIVTLGLLIAADGELRLYSILGALCGFLIYKGTIEPLLGRAFALLSRIFGRIGSWLSGRHFVKKLFR